MRKLPRTLRFVSYYYLLLVTAALAVCFSVPFSWSVTEFGTFEPVDKHLVKANIEGVISEVYVQGGQRVTAGQVIAQVRDPRIELTEAANKVAYRRADMERRYAREMYRRGFASRTELRVAEMEAELERMKVEQAGRYQITSPVDGVFLTTDDFSLRRGDYLQPGAIVGAVAPGGEMRMKVRIAEHNMSKVKPGDKVRIYVNAYPSTTHSTLLGRLATIEPEAVIDSSGIHFVATVALAGPVLPSMPLASGMAGYAKIVYEKSSFASHLIGQAFRPRRAPTSHGTEA